MTSGTILVVEDDLENREVLLEVLQREGYVVAGVANGIEALHYLRNSPPPSLIMLDLMMPKMDGWEFRARQRADPALAMIPVALLSAGSLIGEEAAAIGAVAYVRKPILLENLIATVKRCCP